MDVFQINRMESVITISIALGYGYCEKESRIGNSFVPFVLEDGGRDWPTSSEALSSKKRSGSAELIVLEQFLYIIGPTSVPLGHFTVRFLKETPYGIVSTSIVWSIDSWLGNFIHGTHWCIEIVIRWNLQIYFLT